MPSIQAIRSWTRVIPTFEEVPEPFRNHLEAYMNNVPQLPYVVFIPPERAVSGKVNPKIICAVEDEILIFEKEKKQIRKTSLKIKNINYLESGSVLLYSWIKINGLVDGKTSTISITFNTTTESLFEPIIEKVRKICPIEDSKAQLSAAQEAREKLLFLSTLNFKFMNMAIKSLSGENIVEQILFQPEIKVPTLKLFGRTFYKTLVKTSLIVLTNKELILIRDPNDMLFKSGGVMHYISLDKLKDIWVMTTDEQIISSLTMEFSEGERLLMNLGYSNLGEIQGLIGIVKSLS